MQCVRLMLFWRQRQTQREQKAKQSKNNPGQAAMEDDARKGKREKEDVVWNCKGNSLEERTHHDALHACCLRPPLDQRRMKRKSKTKAEKKDNDLMQ